MDYHTLIDLAHEILTLVVSRDRGDEVTERAVARLLEARGVRVEFEGDRLLEGKPGALDGPQPTRVIANYFRVERRTVLRWLRNGWIRGTKVMEGEKKYGWFFELSEVKAGLEAVGKLPARWGERDRRYKWRE